MVEQLVAREAELNRLNDFLAATLAGEMQVCFVSGEAGAGKTGLVETFVRNAAAATPRLVYVTGLCNAQIGLEDPYHPFRDILTQLTGDAPAMAVGEANVRRLRQILDASGGMILELAPSLLGLFMPAGELVGNAALYLVDKAGLVERVRKRALEVAAGQAELGEEQIFSEYTALLRALSEHQPLILIIEDLHWADSPSIALLFHLIRQLTDSAVLLIGTYRPEDLAVQHGSRRHPLEATLNEIKRYRGDVWIDLQQVKRTRGRAFVDALIDTEPNALDQTFREALFEHSEGNPLYTIEILRNLQECGHLVRDTRGRWIPGETLAWDKLPARVEGVMEERIGRLDAHHQAILRTASVEGQAFTAQVVADVMQLDLRSLLRQLTHQIGAQHRLVVEEGVSRLNGHMLSRYRFSHALTQQYLYHDLGPSERMLLHADVATALEALYGSRVDEIALQLLRHYAETSEWTKVAHYGGVAADRALKMGAYREAVDLCRQVLKLVPEGECATRALFLLRLARAHDRQGDFAATLRPAGDALALAQDVQDHVLEAQALLRLGESQLKQGHHEEAEQCLSSARSVALAHRLSEYEARALGLLGKLHVKRGAFAEAQTLHRRGVEIARDLADRNGLARALEALAHSAQDAGDYELASQSYTESLAIYRELDDPWGLAITLGNQATLHIGQGRLAEARAVLEEGLLISRKLGSDHRTAIYLINVGEVARDLGEYVAAEEAYTEALALGRKTADPLAVAISLNNLGHLAAQQGFGERARGFLHESILVAQQVAPPVSLDALCGLAELEVQAGNPQRAAELVGLVVNHPAVLAETRDKTAQPILEELNKLLSTEELDTSMMRGKSLQLDELINQLLGPGQEEIN